VKPAEVPGAGETGDVGEADGSLDGHADDGVKDGLLGDAAESDGAAEPKAPDELAAAEKPLEPDEEDGRSPPPGPPVLAAPAVPSPGWLVAGGPVLVARAANQLFVAAIACLTAWRPLSSTPLPDPGVSPRRSSSAF
jgi:hypothetical protein